MGTGIWLGILSTGLISGSLTPQCTTLHSANSPPTTKDTPSIADREPTAQKQHLGDAVIVQEELLSSSAHRHQVVHVPGKIIDDV